MTDDVEQVAYTDVRGHLRRDVLWALAAVERDDHAEGTVEAVAEHVREHHRRELATETVRKALRALADAGLVEAEQLQRRGAPLCFELTEHTRTMLRSRAEIVADHVGCTLQSRPDVATDGGRDLDALVWQEPENARAWHVFDEEDGRSLCGKYPLDQSDTGKLLHGYDDVEQSNSYKQRRDCKACCREAGLLDEDDGVATDGGSGL